MKNIFLLIGFIFLVAFAIFFWGTLGYVAMHFIRKFW